MLVIPMINGTKVFGFAESAPAGGSVHGVLHLTPADALHIQSSVEIGEPLSYCGPVWTDGKWKNEAFLISLRDMHIAPGALVRLWFSKAAGER